MSNNAHEFKFKMKGLEFSMTYLQPQLRCTQPEQGMGELRLWSIDMYRGQDSHPTKPFEEDWGF